TAVRLEPLCCARRVTAPQAPLRTAAALPIQVSTGTCNPAVSLPDPSWVRLGSLIMRLTCFRAVQLSTPISQNTDALGRSRGDLLYPHSPYASSRASAYTTHRRPHMGWQGRAAW